MNSLMFLVTFYLISSINSVASSGRKRVRKTSINFDLSLQVPDKISIAPARDFMGCFYYTIRVEYEREYKIGTVSDNGIIISQDHPQNTHKHVFLMIMHTGRYVEVDISRRDGNGKITKKIEEFYRGPNDLVYHPVDRDPVKFDLTRPRFIYLIDDYLFYSGVVKYFIRDQLVNGILLGVIKYGDYIIDDTIEGVIYKYVIVDDNINSVTVTMYMNDATRIDRIYGNIGGSEPFVLLHEIVFDIFLSR